MRFSILYAYFFFFFQMDESPEGKVYAQRYHVYDFPHIGFIDPRTRRLMWKKEGWTQENPMTAELFAETAMDFCSRHSFDKPPVAPRPSSGVGAAAAAPVMNNPNKRSISEMSDEERIQEAIRASLAESSTSGTNNGATAEAPKSDSDDGDVEFLGTNSTQEDTKPKAEEKGSSLIDELLVMPVGDEPGTGARIQLKMPDGKRQVRKFDASQTVKTIYAFIAVRISLFLLLFLLRLLLFSRVASRHLFFTLWC